jgi:hypothetical protein
MTLRLRGCRRWRNFLSLMWPLRCAARSWDFVAGSLADPGLIGLGFTSGSLPSSTQVIRQTF